MATSRSPYGSKKMDSNRPLNLEDGDLHIASPNQNQKQISQFGTPRTGTTSSHDDSGYDTSFTSPASAATPTSTEKNLEPIFFPCNPTQQEMTSPDIRKVLKPPGRGSFQNPSTSGQNGTDASCGATPSNSSQPETSLNELPETAESSHKASHPPISASFQRASNSKKNGQNVSYEDGNNNISFETAPVVSHSTHRAHFENQSPPHGSLSPSTSDEDGRDLYGSDHGNRSPNTSSDDGRDLYSEGPGHEEEKNQEERDES